MDKQSLQDIWDEATDRFQNLTGRNLRLKPAKTLDDVRREMEAQQSQADASDDRDAKSRASQRNMNLLYGLKVIGGVVAQGASMVFGPADLCFNAISLLIDIPRKIHSFYAAVDGLFEEVSTFLGQFKIYQRIEQFSTIDPDLTYTIHKLMMSFVTICALSIRLRNGSTWTRWKSSMKKVLLDDDSGVKEELNTFKSLTRRQSAVVETLTLQYILENRQNLAELLKTACDSRNNIADIVTGVKILTTVERDRKSAQSTEERLKRFGERLAVSSDAIKASRAACPERWAKNVERTGDWLHTIIEYDNWMDGDSDANPLLLLTGDANSGKSCLVSAIAHSIRPDFGQGRRDTVGTLLAYHFFSKRTEKNSQDLKPVETALKYIALQIAEQDDLYTKKMVETIKEDSDVKDLSCKDLWKTLELAAPVVNRKCFLLLDGLDQLTNGQADELLDILKDLHSLSKDSDRNNVRVFATGKVGTFRNGIDQVTPLIEIERHNQPEIKRYIDHEFVGRDLLQGQDAEVVMIKGLILDKLPETAEGNFSKVQNTLDKISEVVASDGTLTELEKVLSEASQNQEMIAENNINELAEQLSTNEIDELNELLVWVIFGYIFFNVDQLQAALYLRFEKTPLQPLEKKLQRKYAKIFTIDDDLGVLINDDIEEAVKTTKRTQRAADSPKITATITITKANIRTVQNFLWKLTEKGMKDEFEFNESATSTKSKGEIQVNEFDAHLTIVRRSFSLLLADPEKKTKLLAPYLLEYLPYHLKYLREAKELDEIGSEDKIKIGNDIIALFADGDIFEKHWDSCKLSLHDWFGVEPDSGEKIEVFWKWLNDPEAIRGLGKRDRVWLNKLKSTPNPNRSLLRPVTQMVAKKWLQGRSWDAKDAFLWIWDFLSMVCRIGAFMYVGLKKADLRQSVTTKDKSVKRLDEDDSEDRKEESRDDSSDNTESSFIGSSEEGAAAVAKASRWVQSALPVNELNSLWHERLGKTYTALEEFDPAIITFKEAIKLDKQNWRSFEGLAEALFRKDGNPVSAVLEMEKALEILQRMEKLDEEEKSSLLEDLMCLADWRTDLHQLDNAIKLYGEVLDIEPKNYKARCGILKIFLTPGYEERAQELLNLMSTKKAEDSDLSLLAVTLQALVHDSKADVIFGMMFSIVQQTNAFNILLDNMRQAIEYARREEQTLDLSGLLLHQGTALYYYDHNEERQLESALTSWEQCSLLTNKGSSWELQSIQTEAIRHISLHHFHQATSQLTRNAETHVRKLEEWATNPRVSYVQANSYLASYYVGQGDSAKAKQVLLEDMKYALALLSDEWEYNDHYGYYKLASYLMYYGDYLNALSAWSLVAPTDFAPETPLLDLENEPARSMALELNKTIDSQYSLETSLPERIQALFKEADLQASKLSAESEADKPSIEAWQEIKQSLRISLTEANEDSTKYIKRERKGNLNLSCDGHCNKIWTFADNFYCCMYCPDEQFCQNCWEQLQAEKSLRFVCNAKHNWLHVPEWDEGEYMRIGKGNVKIGGEFKDGARVGGEIVPVEEWLDLLRDEWGIPKPKRESEKDKKPKEDC